MAVRKEEHVHNVVKGAVIGATIGAPFRGQTSFKPIHFYEPIPARMAASEVLDAWVVAAKHLAAGRGPQKLGLSFRTHFHYQTNELGFAQANLAAGMGQPLSGSFANPLANGCGALGRSLVWGVLHPGDPAGAQRFAFFDAAIDHDPDTAKVSAALAGAAAIAESGWTFTQLVGCIISGLPPGSDALALVTLATREASAGSSAPAAIERLLATSGKNDILDAGFNLALSVYAILLGQSDFPKTLSLAAGCGAAADQNAVVAGGLLALIGSDIPSDWVKPVGKEYVAGHGLKKLDPPNTIEELGELIFKAMRPQPEPEPIPEPETASAEAEPAAAESTEQPEPIVAAPEPAPAPVAVRTIAPITNAPTASQSVFASRGVETTVEFLSPPTVQPDVPVKLAIRFASVDGNQHSLEPRIEAPPGWQAATKLTACRVRPEEPAAFPVVLQMPPDAQFGDVKLFLGTDETRIPLVTPIQWYWCGPFQNHEGTGFDKAFRAEDVWKTKEVFNGRSDLPVNWAEVWVPGHEVDLEPHFRSGPGVIYLWSRPTLEPGKYKLVVSTGVGAQAWADRSKLLWYHDTHEPVARAIKPYVGEFDASGPTTILVKILRNLTPIGPVTVYLVAEDGRIVRPTEFEPMPE